MKVQALFVVLIASMASPAISNAQQSGRSTSVALGPEQDRWKRNQPRIEQLSRWNGVIVAVGEGAFQIDIAKGTANRLRVKDGRDVIAVATFEKTRQAAVVQDGDARKLVEVRGEDIIPIELPESVWRSNERALLVGDELQLITWSGQSVFQFAQGRWREIPLPREAYNELHLVTPGVVAPSLIRPCGQRVYLGFDRGEWGGGILCCNTDAERSATTRVWESIQYRGVAIRCGPDGRTWAADGLAHLSMFSGYVRVNDGQNWTTFVETKGAAKKNKADKSQTTQPATESNTTTKWPFGDTDVRDIDFDEKGRPCILTGGYGVVRWEDERWVQVTRDWPKGYTYTAALLMLPDDKAVIGLFDAGVLVWDLKTQGVTRIAPWKLDGDCQAQFRARVLKTEMLPAEPKQVNRFRVSLDIVSNDGPDFGFLTPGATVEMQIHSIVQTIPFTDKIVGGVFEFCYQDEPQKVYSGRVTAKP